MTTDPVAVRRLAVAAAACAAALALLAGPEGRLLVALAALLLCPGYLLERWLLRGADLPPLARPALWPALGASAVALLYQWAAALGVSLAPAALQALAAACALATLAWAAAGAGRSGAGAPEARLAPLLLAAVFGLTLWTRLAQVRGLAAPVWVDSLHHALLIRVAAERGQAPYSLLPYLPIEGLTYHSGYHALVAAALRAGALEVPGALPQAMLLSGQVLGALVAVAWGAAAAALWRRPTAGVAAALVVGLASIMPAYYLSWGRYTLLLGMLILPGALVAARLALRGGRGAPVALGVVLAGLSLVHFVVLWLALLWLLALLAAEPGGLWARLRRVLAAGTVAIALTAPWLALLAGQARLSTGSSGVNVAGNPTYNRLPVELLWAGSNRALAALAGLGALLMLRRRARAAAAVAVWLALAALMANPPLLGLPYVSFFNNEFVAITLFGPLALLVAGGAAELERRLSGPAWYPLLQGAAALALGAWLAAGFQSVVRQDTVLATADDMRAVAWAAGATPPDARFVVDTARWLYDVDRGGDGGWWLLPLAGRQVSTPPVVFNYGAEPFVRAVKADTSWLRGADARDPPALAAFMRERGYGYVYVSGRSRSLDAAALRSSPLFVELRREGDVSILRLAGAP